MRKRKERGAEGGMETGKGREGGMEEKFTTSVHDGIGLGVWFVEVIWGGRRCEGWLEWDVWVWVRE